MKDLELTGSDLLREEPTLRFFTVSEAQRTLPLVRRIVADIVSECAHIRDLGAQRTQRTGRVSSEDKDKADADIEASVSRFNALLRELEPIGCQMKDPRIGLIDFPARYKDRIVLLCWKLGEPRIDHWHEIDTGFPGRRPISELAPADPE